MDSSNPLFSFKWSIKRSSAGDTKILSSLANQSYDQFQTGERNDFYQNTMIQLNADTKGDDNEELRVHEADMVDDEIQAIQEAMLSQLHISQKNESRDEESATTPKKLKRDEATSNCSGAMDVDRSSSEKVSPKKDQNIHFQEHLKELQDVGGKYSQWLSGQWVPTKEDALQLYMHSKILQKQFQEIAKESGQEEVMVNIVEMSSTLVESVKGSIVQCDACSLELMDYSSEKEVLEQMTTRLSELENTETFLSNWIPTPHSQNQGDKLEEQVIDEQKKLNTPADLNLAIFNEDGFQQEKNSTSDHISLHKNTKKERAKQVRKFRLLLHSAVTDTLDNFEQWSEKHLDKTMQKFLDTKRQETLVKRNSVDDILDFVSKCPVKNYR